MIKETTFRRFRYALTELLNGYPDYVFYGKIESYIKSGKEGIDLLEKHQIIDKIPLEQVKKLIEKMPPEEVAKLPKGELRFLWYRLAPRGVDLAISAINLEHSEEMRKFTIAVIVLTVLTFMVGVDQLILAYLQHPLF